MTWQLRIGKSAQKDLARVPRHDREHILEVLRELSRDPYSTRGVARLKAHPTPFRLRVGNYRIFFDLVSDPRIVDVTHIERRTTTTYRRR